MTLSTELCHQNISNTLTTNELLLFNKITTKSVEEIELVLLEHSYDNKFICYGLYEYIDENLTSQRTIFYEGKMLIEYAETTYPLFHVNTFLYNISNKLKLNYE